VAPSYQLSFPAAKADKEEFVSGSPRDRVEVGRALQRDDLHTKGFFVLEAPATDIDKRSNLVRNKLRP